MWSPLLGHGTLEHTITALWEYVLLLELCYKVLEKDKIPHIEITNFTKCIANCGICILSLGLKTREIFQKE